MAFDILTRKQSPVGWARGAEVGSIILPKGQQRDIFRKIDDVRYDMRATKRVVGAAAFTLAGAFAFLGIASIYRTSKLGKK